MLRPGSVGVKLRGGELTDNEGALVALILREQPVSAYQVAKLYDDSPIHTFNTAKGKLYPLLRRLEEHGLLTSEDVPGDQRRTHLYSCTEAGRQALRLWTKAIRPEHELLHDPLRKKLQAFDLLSADEQLAWVREARARLGRKLDAVEAYDAAGEGRFGALAQDNARVAIKGRLEWLDRMEQEIGRHSHK
jgi:DNA-binding PadR family transcriptional regulator